MLECLHTTLWMMPPISVVCGLFLSIQEEHSHVWGRVLHQWIIQLLACFSFVHWQQFTWGKPSWRTAACPWDRWQRRRSFSVPEGDCYAALHCVWPNNCMNLHFHFWGTLIQSKPSCRASPPCEVSIRPGPVTHDSRQTSMCFTAVRTFFLGDT